MKCSRLFIGGALVLAPLVSVLAPAGVEAQDLCIGAPKRLPALSGAPRWLESDTSTTSTVLPALNDPRWANAPRQPFADNFDDASFRIAYDANYLLVSIELQNDGTRTSDDRIYFGVSNGTTAFATRMSIAAPAGTTGIDDPQDHAVDNYWNWQMDDTGAWTDGDGPDVAKPEWLTTPAIWVRQSTPDTWGVNFKVSLAALTYAAGNPLRLYVGTRSAIEGGGIVLKRFPDSASTTPYVMPSELGGTTGNRGMIPRSVDLWKLTTPVGDACEGISLSRTAIGIQTAAGDYTTLTSFVSAGGNTQHHLIANPTRPNASYDPADPMSQPTTPIGDSNISAEFRLANWGSQATRDAWTTIESVSGPTEIMLSGEHFDLTCPPNVGSVADIENASICGVPLAEMEGAGSRDSHQCMLVEMTSRVSDGSIQFASASEYRNMTFDTASTIERIATLNVKGLQAVTGNSNARDVYLYVRRRNMPPVGRELIPELPRAEMYTKRFQVTGELACDDPEDECVMNRCSWECSDDSEFPCGYDQRLDVEGCWCAPWEEFEVCVPPADPHEEDLDDEQALATVWPFYQVWAYYDTGARTTINGVVHRELKPMSPFGLMIDHQGGYYGFSDSLTALNGATLERVTTDVYRIRVPNEGSAQVLVTVTAHEEAVDVPLIDIQGAATNLGLFGSVELVALSASNQPLNLSRATARVDELLFETGNRELVSNVSMPTTLTRQWGATPTWAKFRKSSLFGPSITMEVIELPLLGRLTTTVATGVAVSRPASCNILGGWTHLATTFRFTDGVNQPLVTSGEDTWACAPFTMLNF